MLVKALRQAAMSHRVFVYGTLKTGEPNHHVITNRENGVAQLLGAGRTVRVFPLLIASTFNIPYLLYKPGTGHRVRGEVYGVDDQMLKLLDDFENHPTYYKRQAEDIELDDGSTLSAWAYFLVDFKEELLQKPLLENYSSSGAHGLVYTSRYLRDRKDPKHEHYLQVKELMR
ncbi:gamma-glutamylaminecyclotransferase B isoform 1 [Tropilaelaps mercedesae]|uniref:Gamma-glutamylcyclotransferase family protein n=1 Tax=Tropilaelaps mercedesae TaxID=418985 RepID=A0A1V9XIC3_9ACAR|nr:gamma-glutamylaminecyclotransferase B isoform 1 [Tropilaelaps mercedesae]